MFCDTVPLIALEPRRSLGAPMIKGDQGEDEKAFEGQFPSAYTKYEGKCQR